MAVQAPPDQICTGNGISTTLIRFTFMCPSDLWIQELIYGMMSLYSDPDVFYKCGTTTPEQAADAMSAVWESLTVINDTGTIIAFAGIAPPANTLPCDGASYLRTAFPTLFAAIGTVWGSVDSTHFNVPDLRGRTLIDAGQGVGLSNRVLAQKFGEENHTLVLGELPSHTHGVANQLTELIVAPPVGAFPIPAISIGAQTGSAGGGGGHNNMQPTAVINYAIVT